LDEIERLLNILERSEEIRFLARDNFEFVISIFLRQKIRKIVEIQLKV
jgi:hypothetical protein